MAMKRLLKISSRTGLALVPTARWRLRGVERNRISVPSAYLVPIQASSMTVVEPVS